MKSVKTSMRLFSGGFWLLAVSLASSWAGGAFHAVKKMLLLK